MPTYRLEPVKGAERHHYWGASLVPPVPVWVQATNPEHARQRIHWAALQDAATPNIETCTPWTDTVLVRCIEDESHFVPPSLIMFANGKITLRIPAAETYMMVSFSA